MHRIHYLFGCFFKSRICFSIGKEYSHCALSRITIIIIKQKLTWCYLLDNSLSVLHIYICVCIYTHIYIYAYICTYMPNCYPHFIDKKITQRLNLNYITIKYWLGFELSQSVSTLTVWIWTQNKSLLYFKNIIKQ